MADTPGQEPEARLPVPRPPVEPAPVERFSSPASTRSVELSPERAAQVVRQSSNARWVGFLAVVVIILFTTIYWFYELAPLGIREPRLVAEANSQQVTSVERGYNLYVANCARCHGPNGQGGIGPVLNSQEKLYAHLSVDYLNNILIAGGRYACGTANSIMPIWSNEGRPAGPLNYIQIEDLIAFMRAPSNQTYTIRDPELGEPRLDPVSGVVRTFNGWRDVDYKPAPGSTPYPACWSTALTGTPAPSGAPAASGPPAASADPNVETVSLVASQIAWTTPDLSVSAGKPFVIALDNQDAGVPHNIQIKDAAGAVVYMSDTFNGVATRQFQVPALTAGSYPFICTLHPNMTGTLTVK